MVLESQVIAERELRDKLKDSCFFMQLTKEKMEY